MHCADKRGLSETSSHSAPTQDPAYAQRLHTLESARWKRLINAQAPYRWNVRRLRLGRTLDVGCGIGRNLAHLDGNGVGVDHNAAAIEVCRSKGLEAYTVEEFHTRPHALFDSLLAAHLVEHLSPPDGKEVLSSYLPYLKPGGSVVVITPQERGYASDDTHVYFADFTAVEGLLADLGVRVDRTYSFPLPRWTGRFFTYNEFVTVGRKLE